MIDEINQERFRSYLVGFTRNIDLSIKQIIRPRLILLQLIAIFLTIPLVVFGIDWQYFQFFRYHSYLQPLLFPAVPIGTFVPIIFPAMVYLYGVLKNLHELKFFGYTLTHTAVVGLMWSALFKAFTGRHGPEFDEYSPGVMDYSNEFFFGFLLGGVFDGWPSGHTTIAVATGIVYFKYKLKDTDKLTEYDDFMAKLLRNRWIGLVYAIYIAFGISTNIHWFSDAVAGLLFGICVAIASLRTNEQTFSINNEQFEEVRKEIETGEYDKFVKNTFLTLAIIIFFSIVVPREILGL